MHYICVKSVMITTTMMIRVGINSFPPIELYRLRGDNAIGFFAAHPQILLYTHYFCYTPTNFGSLQKQGRFFCCTPTNFAAHPQFLLHTHKFWKFTKTSAFSPTTGTLPKAEVNTKNSTKRCSKASFG